MKEVFLPLFSQTVDMNERLPLMKPFITLALWIFSLGAVLAQPTFTMSDDMKMAGDTIEIDVTVSDFNKISSIQYLHGFDSMVIEYIDVIDKSPNLGGLSHLGPEGATVDNGQIVITWNDPLGENVTLADGEVIYTIQFLAIGEECDSSLVNIIETANRKIEVLDENFDNIGLNQNPGTALIPGEDCGGSGGSDIVIRSNSASGANGTEVCLEIRVDNFTDVESMQFSMSWDPAIISYSRVANFNLMNLNQASFNNGGPGSLRAIWDPGNAGSVTLNNNTRIFDLCFNIVGSSGQMSDVDFVDTPLPIEFNTGSGTASFRTNSGKVTVTGGGGGDELELIMGDISGECGDCDSAERLCIPLSVNNFVEVEAMQFSISYPGELVYCEAQNFMLNGLTPANVFNPSVGVLRVVWDDPNANSQTVPDGTVLMELCFSTQVGDAMYPVEFSNVPLAIEVTTSTGTADVDTTNGKITVAPCMGGGDIQVSLDSKLDLKCADRCQGFISINVAGGSGQYEIIWSRDGVPYDTTSSTSQFNLCGGVYSVKVTDINDRSKMGTLNNIVINAPDPIETELVTIPVTSGCNGQATYIITGGTPPYTFNWSNGARDSIATNLCKGDYNLTIFDSEGCSFITDTFTLAGPPLVFGNPQITEPDCYGDCNGAIAVSATGGCGMLTYRWAPAQGIDVNSQNQSGLCAGMYTVSVTDTMGTTESLVITVTQPDSIKIELDSIQNGTLGGIFITVTGGTVSGDYTYAWKDSMGILVSQDEDPTNLPPGRYTVMVMDDNNCMRSKSYTISISDLNLMADVSDYNGVNVSCFGESDGSINITVANGVGPFSYSWDHDPQATGPMQTGLPAGTYKITVMDQSNGATKVITVTLSEPDLLDANVVDRSCADGLGSPTGSYEVTPTGGTAPYEYLWCNNSDNRVPLDLIGGVDCNVLVTDVNGCQVFIDDFEICFDSTGPVTEECFIGRDVITPNGDQFNEFFIISCLDDPRYANNELFLFNRWGQEINSYTNYRNQWNGLDVDGNEVDEDTYMWVLKVVLPTAEQRVYRGAVTLLRN